MPNHVQHVIKIFQALPLLIFYSVKGRGEPVEPPNKGYFGDTASVLISEVVKNSPASSDPLPQTSIKMGRGNGGCGLLSISQKKLVLELCPLSGAQRSATSRRLLIH